MRSTLLRCAVTSVGLAAAGCGKTPLPIKVDGSSTVYPMSEAAAEEYGKDHPKVRVTVGISGTGGGFEKFCRGETDISDASRPINASEVALCSKGGVEYVELPIAYDGLAIIVNPKASWIDSIAVADLKKIWQPEAQGVVQTWHDVRPEWPDRPLHLFGPGVASGTYDYFTAAIVGTEHSSRMDFTASEDDNVLVQGIAKDDGALGFFGLGYYESNRDKLKLLAVDDGNPANGAGAITPSQQTVRDGSYQPLSRPLFLYVARKSFDRREVDDFVTFYLDHGAELADDAGYVSLPKRAYRLAYGRAARRTTGSVFGGKGSRVGVSIESLMEMDAPPSLPPLGGM